MGRKARAEVEGGLYHVITRGNNRQQIFSSAADYEKFLRLLVIQKAKLPFYLYSYCLMTNHVHLLIERQAATVGQIMHRVLTGYSNYYNRKHKRVGHLLQARHKSILCQSDRYLAELVRYIHLNPVRAGMVNLPEEYKYSGHAAYLGLVPAGILDIDPVLRHFGARKKQARQAYQQFVNAGIALGHQDSWYSGEDNRILGNEEFVDSVIHHIGETRGVNASSRDDAKYEFNPKLLLEAVEQICGISRGVICSSAKHRAAIAAKEVLVLTGSQLGATRNQLSDLTGMSESAISRRKDAADVKARWLASFRKLTASVLASYQNRCSEIAKSQA